VRHAIVLLIALLASSAFARAGAGAVGPGAGPAAGDRPRRVLMVHSFGSSAPPFTTHSTAFQSAIKRELGTAAVDLDEVSLDMARYAQPDMEAAFADFLAKRISKWQPDLVVPIGSPAGKFVVKFRDRLFPSTPVVYTGMDRRTLPADAFANNATFVGESFDLGGLIEDMLQLDPQTNHVVVILGATPLERYWSAAFREAFEPFADRVKFTFVNDLSFEQMLDEVSKLPPHSFVLLGLLLRDASGVTFNQDDALARLHAASAAPINGMYQHEVGLGIVGGRLYQGELEGIESARVAARILRGEASASQIPPQVIGTREPMYDWRELRRWGISESRLPPGSVVLFREPSAWQRYRWHVILAAAVIATQGVLIVALLVQRRRRRLAEAARLQAEAEAHRKTAELEHVSRVVVLGELTATLAHEIGQPLTAIRTNSAAGGMFLDKPQPDLAELRATLRDIEFDSERASQVVRRIRDMLRDRRRRASSGASASAGGAGSGDTAGFTRVDLNDLVRTTVRLVRHDAALNDVVIHLQLCEPPAVVDGDAVELQQVLLNLMLNAFAAMKDHGPQRQLIVRTNRIEGDRHAARATRATGATGATRAARIELQDSGTGIPPDKLESIFDPFFTTKPDGLGMGLPICRTLVERHRGRIWAANNASGGGATFSVELPLPATADHPPNLPAHPPADNTPTPTPAAAGHSA
jgi:signal transduction histidine kinase